MRASFLPLGVCLLFSLPGCGEAPTDAATSTASADTVEKPKWCLYPTTHLFNGVSQVFTLDRFEADGTSQPVISRSSGFYWHGALISLAQQSTESWSVRSASEIDGTHVQGWSGQGTIALDLIAPQGELAARSGVVRVHPTAGGEDEIVPIGRVDTRCPRATQP